MCCYHGYYIDLKVTLLIYNCIPDDVLQVVAEGADLSGVILSLSGDTYRSNNFTNEKGEFSFIGLVR